MKQQTEQSRWQRFRKNMQATYKSMDTEEWWDIYVTRPIGYVEACIFRYFHIHPNVVTVLSIFIGVFAGYFFMPGQTSYVLLATAFLFIANTFDSADGQLARMTRQYTMLGRVLDGFAGDLWFVSIYSFMMVRMMHTTIPFTDTPWGWWPALIVPLCGFYFHATQAGLADYYRTIHLHFLNGNSYSDLTRSSVLIAQRKTLKWRDWFQWIWLFFYGQYTRNQESKTPQLQRLLAAVEQYPGELPQGFRDEYRAYSLPLMKYTNILTFNTRFFVLVISMLIGYPCLYLFYEIVVLSGLALYMYLRHERFCRVLYNRWFAHEK